MDFLFIRRRTIRVNIEIPGLIGKIVTPTNKTLYLSPVVMSLM